jgi:ABC-2 type transport system permease protein
MRRVVWYIERDFLRWVRGKVNVFSSLVMPAAWLVFVGLALPIRFTDNYLDFITPGILVMTMLSAGLSGGTLLMFDKILGFFNKFLALPSPREDILFGKILFTSMRGLIQTTIILVIAVLIGAKIYSPLQYGLTYLILFLFGFLLSAFSTTLVLYLEDHDSYSAVNTMISMPLFFTSSALMPYSVMPAWLRFLASLNPLSYAIDAIRAVNAGAFPSLQITVLAVLVIVVTAISVQVFRRVTV